MPGDFIGVRTEPEVPVLIDQRHQAAWLAADDRDALTRKGQKFLQILPAQLAAELQEALGDRRAAATAQAGQDHPVTARFQHPHRRDANIRVVVRGEAVIEQHDRPAPA